MRDVGYFRGGSGQELVLLHGLGMSWRAWRPVLDRLTEHHDVLAITLPGHRGGPKMHRPASAETMAGAVANTIAAQGFKSPHVVGNSLGGLVAMHLAATGQAGSLTLFSPAGAWVSQQALVRVELALAAGRASLGHPAAPLGAYHRRSRRKLLSGLVAHGDRVTRDDAVSILRDMRSCRAFPEVLKFGRRDGMVGVALPSPCPIHIAWGDHDRVLPFSRYGRPLLARVPGAAYTRIGDAGHVPWFDQPQAVVDIIAENSSDRDLRAERRSP